MFGFSLSKIEVIVFVSLRRKVRRTFYKIFFSLIITILFSSFNVNIIVLHFVTGIRQLSLISNHQLFLCDSGDEIRPIGDRCNIRVDCKDFSDERNCENCKRNIFHKQIASLPKEPMKGKAKAARTANAIICILV